MAGFGIEYIIRLVDQFSAIADRVGKSAIDAEKGIGGLGKEAMKVDEQMAKLATGMSGVNKATAGIVSGSKEAATALGQLGQAANKSADEQIAAFRKAAQARYDTKFSNNPRYFNADGSSKSGGGGWFGGKAPGEREGGAREGRGLGVMGGMFALSMLHNDVLKTWVDFDDQIRKIQGTMAGQLSDADIGELRRSALAISKGTRFAPDDIAKVFLEEASRGVPVNERTKDGKLLAAVIAKQMLGIATGTGEDPAETFKTHLAIQRGFELPFSDFPHISDTIARIHQQTGITLNQIATQMGQVAAVAHTAGWTEEQTVGTVGYLAKRGMGQYAGSGLSRLISKSQAWSKPAAEFWKALGIGKEDVIDQATGGMLAPDAMMKLLQDHTKGMRQADVAAAFSKMFGDRGVKIASALLGGDPKELSGMIAGLQNVQDLAEKMGDEGSKGGAAGIARFAASWKALQDRIGDAGYGDWVGGLARHVSDLFDAIGGDGKSTIGLNAIGLLAGGLNLLSSAALPIIALDALGGGKVLGKLYQGSMLLASGIGAMAARSAGLAGLATSMSRMAVAGRLLMGVTGISAGLLIGYEVYQNWDKISAAAEKLWGALSKIGSGNWKAGFSELGKELSQINTDLGKAAGRLPGTPDPDKVTPFYEYLRRQDGETGIARRGIGNATPPLSPAAAATNAASQRVQADINVRSTIDPIQVQVPPTVRLEGTLTGANGASANVNGSMPLSATAPRGTTAASPANPRVAR